MLHRYPIIGRFAASLRPRSYLWSIRRIDVQRAYYAGSIISFLPLFGIQLPLALLAALLLRCNFMILGGLQLVTNPFTAGPIYYLTHELGVEVLAWLPRSEHPMPIAGETEWVNLSGYGAETAGEEIMATPEAERWTKRARDAIRAMSVGGLIVGLCGGLILDLLDRILRTRAQSTRPRNA